MNPNVRISQSSLWDWGQCHWTTAVVMALMDCPTSLLVAHAWNVSLYVVYSVMSIHLGLLLRPATDYIIKTVCEQ